MWRRTIWLLTPLVFGLLCAPFAPDAQPPGQVPRIGFVEPGAAAVNGHFLAAFRQGLRAFGWVEGQNLVIEDRWAEGQYERFPALVAELLRLKVQVVVASGQGALAAKQATATVPIVFTGVDDPVGDGLVASLARPGGNLTGLANIGPQLSGKRLEVLREALPHLAHVALLLEPYNATAHIHETAVAARAFGITLQAGGQSKSGRAFAPGGDGPGSLVSAEGAGLAVTRCVLQACAAWRPDRMLPEDEDGRFGERPGERRMLMEETDQVLETVATEVVRKHARWDMGSVVSP